MFKKTVFKKWGWGCQKSCVFGVFGISFFGKTRHKKNSHWRIGL